jgi:hypothetical protein
LKIASPAAARKTTLSLKLLGGGLRHPRVIDSVKTEFELDTVVVVAPDQVSCALGDEAAILHVTKSVYYGVNPVGASIWNLLKTPKTVREIRDALLQEYEVEAGRCERDLFALLEKLCEEGLIRILDSAGAAKA